MKKVDIEKLVQWALSEELPKGRAVSTSAWDLVSSYAVLGTRVDTSGGCWSDALGYVPGEPHPDAGLIAYAIEMLPADMRFEDRLDVAVLFGDYASIAGDAIEAIMCATFNARALVLSKAVLGTRPAWDFEAPTPHRQFIPSGEQGGKPAALVQGVDADGDIIHLQPRRGRAAMRDGLYDIAMSPRSPLLWADPSLISIGHARAEYVAWHTALDQLARNLAGRMQDHEALPPTVRPAPWLTGQAPAPKVWRRESAQSGPADPKKGPATHARKVA